MATIKTEITTLIGRCRRVGWSVELQDSGNAYKITFDDKSVYLVHASYSDRNAPKRVLRHLEKMGLLDKETVIDEKHEADKAARLAADRKTAAAAGRKMAAQAKLTAKAAGPYAGPQARPYEWYMADHPAPHIEFVVIDPPLARQLMRLNVDNVPIHKPTVEFYRSVMSADGFLMTHQGMALDTRKVLQDGQKRLQACIDSDKSICVAFAVGMPPENFKAIDEGRNRSIADLLGKDEVADRNTTGTTLRLIAAYREPFPRAFYKRRVPNAMLYDAFKGDPARLSDAVTWGRRHYVNAGITCSALSAALYLLREANGRDNDFVQAFFNGLASGTKGTSRLLLDVDDPRLLLRADLKARRARGNRLRALDQLGSVLLAWNLVVEPKPGKVKWIDGGDTPLPAITVCQDKGRMASAPPDRLRGEFTPSPAQEAAAKIRPSGAKA